MTRHKDLELDILKLPLVEFIKIKGLQLRHYDKKRDVLKLVSLFNTIWAESGEPSITLTEEVAKQLPEEKVIIAEFHGELVGFVIFDVIEEEGEKKGVFRFIGVHPDYRGKKIASAMAFRAGEDMLKYRITKIKSLIPEKNDEALHLMKFFGFESRKEVDYTPKFPI
ncbi:MAG: GNAT family N-acetyltransferase [Candidatus Helarchaeota archaeon]